MSEVTDRTIFPNNTFIPTKFGMPQLVFLLKYAGRTPRSAGFGLDPRTGDWTHPELPRQVWCKECQVALQRFYEETSRDDWSSEQNDQMLSSIRKRLAATIAYQKRKQAQFEEHGFIDYDSIGVGLSDGQMSKERFFDMPFSHKHVPVRSNWIEDLVEGLAGEFDPSNIDEALEAAVEASVAEAEKVTTQQAVSEVLDEDEDEPEERMKCFVCDWRTKEGTKRPHVALDGHVRMKHPDRHEDFKAIRDLATPQASEPSREVDPVAEALG